MEQKCISCSKVGDFETELFEIFEDIYYCSDCVDKFKLSRPRKPDPVPAGSPDTCDDYYDIWGDT